MAHPQGGPQQVDLPAGPSNLAPSSQTAGHGQHTRKHRHRKHPSQSYPQNDGAVSDSVMHSLASPQKNQAAKQRHQSVAVGTPQKNAHLDKVNGQKQRPASLGANTLLGTPAAKEQAYAGPTFQASPAPSSLPVPKFFSRSVPNVAGLSLSARLDGERTPEKEDSSPEPDIVAPHSPTRNGQKSPLDLFFNADREEKERSRSSGSLSPEMAKRPPPPATEPRRIQQSAKGTFIHEMDGNSSDMISPKTVSPKKRDYLAQRPTSSPNMTDTGSEGESEREVQTKALKDLLFSNINGASHQNVSTPEQYHLQSDFRAPDQPFNSPSPFNRSTSGPSTPAPTTDQRNHYSLHYGNRNLSPLFKASRNETPSRPSGLRQQELAGEMPPQNAAIPPYPHQIDPNSFSRNYINEHIRSSAPAPLPAISLSSGSNQNLSSFANGPSQQHSVIQNGYTGNASTSGASPRNASTVSGTGGGARDIKGMEDDLRKMLNLNVLSN